MSEFTLTMADIVASYKQKPNGLKCWCGKWFLFNIQDHGYYGKCPDSHMAVVMSFMDATNTFILSELKAEYERKVLDVERQRIEETSNNHAQ